MWSYRKLTKLKRNYYVKKIIPWPKRQKTRDQKQTKFLYTRRFLVPHYFLVLCYQQCIFRYKHRFLLPNYFIVLCYQQCSFLYIQRFLVPHYFIIACVHYTIVPYCSNFVSKFHLQKFWGSNHSIWLNYKST